jgi:predicted component of type VI protein secretion system
MYLMTKKTHPLTEGRGGGVLAAMRWSATRSGSPGVAAPQMKAVRAVSVLSLLVRADAGPCELGAAARPAQRLTRRCARKQ